MLCDNIFIDDCDNFLSLFNNILLQLLLPLGKSFFEFLFLSLSFHLSIMEDIFCMRIISTQQLLQLIFEVIFIIETVHVLFVNLSFWDLYCFDFWFLKIGSSLTFLLFGKFF